MFPYLEFHTGKLIHDVWHCLPDDGPGDLVVGLCRRLHPVPGKVVERNHVSQHANSFIEGAVPKQSKTLELFLEEKTRSKNKSSAFFFLENSSHFYSKNIFLEIDNFHALNDRTSLNLTICKPLSSKAQLNGLKNLSVISSNQFTKFFET